MNITYRYPELLNIGKQIKADSCVLDAELVILDKDSKPNFELLQQREQLERPLLIKARSKKFPATLFVFDILEKNGKSLIDLPLRRRKQELEETVENNPYITICPYTLNGKNLWEKVMEQGLEGVMAKELSSKYEQKRSWSWLKIKNLKSMDAVVLGFTPGKGKRANFFGALLLGAYREGKLCYIGKVGTGFNEEDMKRIKKLLKKTKESSLDEKEKAKIREKVKEFFWVKPEIVIEVQFLEITEENELRAPSFIKFRFDKPPSECILEENLEN